MNTHQRSTQRGSDSITLTRQEKGLAKMPTLPRNRAFVVQLYAHTVVDASHISGRIEHVSSGRATHFASWAELEAFIATTLNTHNAERGSL